MSAYTSLFSSCPDSVKKVIEKGVKALAPQSVLLFGSRARGDHRPTSDFDIAFSGINSPLQWTKYVVEVGEEPITLHSIDLVLLEEIETSFRNRILEEGLPLYESERL